MAEITCVNIDKFQNIVTGGQQKLQNNEFYNVTLASGDGQMYVE